MIVATLPSVNTAEAQNLEQLVMPGEVISGHADLEADCSVCHKAFRKTEQKSLCLACHEDVGEDIAGGQGFHGRDTAARDRNCASCHTDHKGRDADIVDFDPKRFDHHLTDFDLEGGHASLSCSDCHRPAEKYRMAPLECIGCHRDDDVHDNALGNACADCHTVTEWTGATFDHEATGYPLLGAHREPACLDCHEERSFRGAPNSCYGCHATDDVHEGRSGQDCGSCHTPFDWTDTSFDHARDTTFPLLESHAMLACGDCHGGDPFAEKVDTACIACHRADDTHDGHNGNDCAACHTSTLWSRSTFDHDRDTGYALRGAHRSVECNACHAEPLFEQALSSDCHSCHLDDDVHDASLGAACGNCHGESGWRETIAFDHDMTPFPLLGAHADTSCESCHASRVFVDAETDCVACHREEDPHADRYTSACAGCHNPVAWDLWFFDHDVQSRFRLEGAHRDVACLDCHRASLERMLGSGDDCGGCHRTDDVHDGEFGADCGRCHSTRSFRDVRDLR